MCIEEIVCNVSVIFLDTVYSKFTIESVSERI